MYHPNGRMLLVEETDGEEVGDEEVCENSLYVLLNFSEPKSAQEFGSSM